MCILSGRLHSFRNLAAFPVLCQSFAVLPVVLMSEYLTTREIAQLLRVKERQVYDLAAKGQLPVRRVTGKLLFPRAEIEAQLHAGAGEAAAPIRPAVMAGGHDPLLEWALREVALRHSRLSRWRV